MGLRHPVVARRVYIAVVKESARDPSLSERVRWVHMNIYIYVCIYICIYIYVYIYILPIDCLCVSAHRVDHYA